MPEHWYDIAYINHDEQILWGKNLDKDNVRVMLSDEQKKMIENIKFGHACELQAVYHGIATA